MQQFNVFGIIKILHFKKALCFCNPFIGQNGGSRLFIDGIVIVSGQTGDDIVDLIVKLGRFFSRTGYDQGRSGFIDEDTVCLIDDDIVQSAQQQLFAGRFGAVERLELEFEVGVIKPWMGLSGEVLPVRGSPAFRLSEYTFTSRFMTVFWRCLPKKHVS